MMAGGCENSFVALPKKNHVKTTMCRRTHLINLQGTQPPASLLGSAVLRRPATLHHHIVQLLSVLHKTEMRRGNHESAKQASRPLVPPQHSHIVQSVLNPVAGRGSGATADPRRASIVKAIKQLACKNLSADPRVPVIRQTGNPLSRRLVKNTPYSSSWQALYKRCNSPKLRGRSESGPLAWFVSP